MTDKESVWSKETQEQIDKTIKTGQELQASVDKIRDQQTRTKIMDDKIRLRVIDNTTHHFSLTFGRPGRTEVSVIIGMPIVHVYEGAEVDTEQDPLFCYDGTLEVNKDCEG